MTLNSDFQPALATSVPDAEASTNTPAAEANLASPPGGNSGDCFGKSTVAPVASRIENECTAENLQLLEGREAVRKRPGMYIGDTGVGGLHELFKEILDNAIDEVLAGKCDRIDVTLGKDRTLSVTDDGHGIRVDTDPQSGQPIAELVMTEIYSDRKHRGNRKLSCGLHGAGVSCVNALSDWIETTIRRDGQIYRMRCERGVIVAPLEVIGTCAPDDHGTTQQWFADSTIFDTALTDTGELDYRAERLIHRIQRMAYLNKEVTIIYRDELNGTEPLVFHYPHGIAEYAASLNEGREALHDKVIYSQQEGETQVEIAIQYTQSQQENIYAFVNSITLRDGGTHIVGFKAALTRIVNLYARKTGFLKREAPNFSGEAVRKGLTAVVAVRMVDPAFCRPDHSWLLSPEIHGIVNSTTADGLWAFFEANPQIAQAILEKIAASATAESATKAAVR